MFKYCSDSHEDIVQKNIARLSEFQINRLNILGPVVDDDYTIWLLSDDWFNAALKSEHERNNISSQHLNYMMAQCGPMLGLLSDSEWLDVESQWNKYFFSIRTFNVNFLGYFWYKGQLSEIAVDGLNIVAWKYASYYLFAREAYKKIRPRIKNENTNRYITKFNMTEFQLANFCMTTLQSNIIDVMHRFKMGNEILDFIKIGMRITSAAYKNKSASDWVEYYESQSMKPKLPKLAY